MSLRNNWDTSYSSIAFLERALSSHKCVESFERQQDIKFVIKRTRSFDPVIAVLVGRYTIGLADVINASAEFPDMQCIVAHGNWCAYTEEAKKYGFTNDVAVFHVGEFLVALFSRSLITYTQKDPNGQPLYAYRSA